MEESGVAVCDVEFDDQVVVDEYAPRGFVEGVAIIFLKTNFCHQEGHFLCDIKWKWSPLFPPFSTDNVPRTMQNTKGIRKSVNDSN